MNKVKEILIVTDNGITTITVDGEKLDLKDVIQMDIHITPGLMIYESKFENCIRLGDYDVHTF